MRSYFQSIAYTRFNISGKGVLWTKIEDGFTPEIIYFFCSRFPQFYILIEHCGKTYVKKEGESLKVSRETAEEALKRYEKALPDNDALKELAKEGQDLWSTFYDSQYIKERKNTRLFHRYIPKYLKDVKTLNKEFSALNPCRKLTDF